MPQLTEQQYLSILRTGTPDDRIKLIRDLPPSSFTDTAIALVGSDNPTTTILAFVSLVQKYCYGGNPELGAPLAAAAHERALEIWNTVPNHGLLATTLSILAVSHAKALSLMGRSKQVIEATDRYIPIYEKLGEHQNLPTLKLLRIEALVNLKRIDDAFEGLQDRSIFDDPVARIEAERLKGVVDRLRAGVTELAPKQAPASAALSPETLLEVMTKAVDSTFEGDNGEALKESLRRLDVGKRVDVNNPTQYKQLLETLRKAESFFTKGGPASELTVRQKIRDASAIFVHGNPEPAVIRASLAELESGHQWAREHRSTELENDALWGIYLCRNRLKSPSEAADALIALRNNLESMRSGIKDPLKRGGIFSTYRYLFNALCEQLYIARRSSDLFEAIESSKGRAIADRLTAQDAGIVADSAIYASVQRIPALARRERFHYLTYFVDEKCVYAVLVSKQGKIHAIDPIQISNEALREAAEAVDPKSWGRPLPQDPATRTLDVSVRLAPLVAWFDKLMSEGIVEKGDHVCYSSDDDFYNIPLQYLRFRDGILVDWVSLSRVHSAFHLDRVLSSERRNAPKRYVGFVVPLTQDVAKKTGGEMLKNLDAPLLWLRDHGRDGESIRLENATLKRLARESLDHRIVHFSTHGWFPKKGNPFYDSYLLLAGAGGLPDKERAAGDDREGKLTPNAIFESKLDLDGSHVAMMACVSGLAKEGIGGDALGLDWAFIQAGASCVVSTHWEVSAACAARFFELYYGKWIGEQKSRAAALRETVIELLHGESKPETLHDWIGFTLTGDFR
jgi:hypothetical protein